MIDEIDFVAEHRKADMSKVNMIKVNDKKYVAIDHVLGIMKNTIRAVSISGIISNFNTLGVLTELYDKFLALKEGEQK